MCRRQLQANGRSPRSIQTHPLPAGLSGCISPQSWRQALINTKSTIRRDAGLRLLSTLVLVALILGTGFLFAHQVFEPEHEEKGLRAAVWGVSFFVLSVFVGSPLLFLVEHLRGLAMV